MTRLVFRSQDEDEGSVQIQTSCIVAQPNTRPGKVRSDGGQGGVKTYGRGIFDIQRDSAAYTQHQRHQPLQVKTSGKQSSNISPLHLFRQRKL